MVSAVEVAGGVAASMVRVRGFPRPAPLQDRARWSPIRAHEWNDRTGWLLGCNFVPSTASNQLELWQEATFDPKTIDRELGWAATTLGMNSIRLFLHDLMWEIEGDRFLDRVDRVLGIAAGHGISVMPVLFDGIWDPEPRPGRQRSPRRGIHNSTWVQGPGAGVVGDRSRWSSLRPYVEAVLGRFGSDPRVVAWDLFNEPDSPNPFYFRRDPSHKRRLMGELVDEVWDWAAETDPDQPLTIGVFLFPEGRHPEAASRVARIALERSDVVSFHCYGAAARIETVIDTLAKRDRPLICTEWMGRPTSPVSNVELLKRRGVGAYTWGLVDGASQTRYPWTSWIRRTPNNAPWFHDLLHADGNPFDRAEAELMASMREVNLGQDAVEPARKPPVVLAQQPHD